MDKEKIIERIKKLIALSEDMSTTEHERNACRKKAHDLMTKFSIDSIHDTKEREIIHQEFSLGTRSSLVGLDITRQCQILSIIGPPLGCYSYYKRREDKVYIMGFKINVEIADYTAHVLINQGKIVCRDLWKLSPTANTKMTFWKGFLEGLRERYEVLESESDGKELVVYDPVKELYQKSVRITQTLSFGSDSEALAKGIQTAKEARVNAGIQTHEEGQRRIG